MMMRLICCGIKAEYCELIYGLRLLCHAAYPAQSQMPQQPELWLSSDSHSSARQ